MSDPDPPSPCTGLCTIEAATRLCRGCARTLDEIAAWSTAGAAGRRAILDRVAGRQGRADRR